MAENKCQHYVPQMLLDKFSRDGKRTDVVILDAGKRIRDVGVRDQCYRDYYYGKDRVMEKGFSEAEGKFAATLGDLSAAHLQSISDVEIIHLRVYPNRPACLYVMSGCRGLMEMDTSKRVL